MSPSFTCTVWANHTHLAHYTRTVSLHRIQLVPLINALETLLSHKITLGYFVYSKRQHHAGLAGIFRNGLYAIPRTSQLTAILIASGVPS